MNVTDNSSRRSAVKSLFTTIAAAGAGLFGMAHTKAAEAASITGIPDESQQADTRPRFQDR